MNVHYLQHVPFEGPGSIEAHLRARGISLSSTQLYADTALPAAASVDWLIVLGGPMSVKDEAAYPWLVQEKRFIRDVIARDKPVLGICLGAQLIAEVLGARVYPNTDAEIGWFPVERTTPANRAPLTAAFPEVFEAFHWHGETFDVPQGAVPLARSVACPHQGFTYNDRVLALQFHLETTPASARALIEHCGNELQAGLHVQSAATMLADPERFVVINALMQRVLNAMEVLA